MATSAAKILAGVAAGGDGMELAWFGATTAAAPTTATSALTGFTSAGMCTTDGLQTAFDEDTTGIPAYGTLQNVRTLLTSSALTFQVAFLESNPVSMGVYYRKAFTDLTPSQTGAVTVNIGSSDNPFRSAVFDIVDGTNHLRVYVPRCQVTGRDGWQAAPGQAIQYAVTLSAYPVNGVAASCMYVLDALAS